MKVLNLRCSSGHGFEGWFASDDDFMAQNGGGLLQCPLCADSVITRMPSAPRLNLSGAGAAEAGTAPSVQPGHAPAGEGATQQMQALWLQTVRHLMAHTEDVGERFVEEARRIHYGEAEQRGIRGQASVEQREELLDEGIDVVSLPIPHALDGPVQ